MATKNGVPFRQVLVPASKYNIKAPYAMNPKKITLHNTDNQMPAINEINYMNSNNNQTSYHVAVDEKEAIQGIPFNRNAWHSGDGGNGYGNRNTVAVEICRNYDRTRKTTNLIEPLKSQYSKAEQNAIKYVAQLCIDLGIVANDDNIKTHNNWNGKWCPSKILNENRLQSVKNAIIAEYNRLKGNNVKPSKPVKPSTNKPKPAAKTLHLPKSADTWRVYKPNGPYTKGNEIHLLTPSAFGGIDYEIKGNPAKDVYLIDTSVKGRVAIYAAPSTGAKITNNKAPVAKPKPSGSSYKENGTFYPNDTIIVRDNPSTGANIVARYYDGEKVTYHTVHLKNGYVWLQYNRSNGKQGYIPCRTYNNGKYGTLWGTIK